MRLHRTPPILPEGWYCKTITIPDSLPWSGIVTKSLLSMIYAWDYAQILDTDMTPDEAAAVGYVILESYLNSPRTCAGIDLAPFWDDTDADDATGEPTASIYAYLEDIADFAVTAFLAVSFSPEAAIEFVTTARKFRVLFRSRDYGAIVDVFLNDVLYSSVDTYSAAPGVVATDVIVPDVMPSDVTLRIEHTGTANPLATPTEAGYGMEVIRKRLTPDEMGVQDIRLNGANVQVQRSIGGAWENVTGGQIAQRDGSLDPDFTGAITIQPIAAEIPLTIKRATSAVVNPLAVFADQTGTALFNIEGTGDLHLARSSPQLRWTAGNFSVLFGTTRIARFMPSAVAFAWEMLFEQYNSNNVKARIKSDWDEPTVAIRRGNFRLTADDAAASREIIRGSTTGTAGKLGFLGASGQVRPTVSGDDGGNLALRELIDALAAYGLITDSTTDGEGGIVMLRQNPANACQLEQSVDGETWTLAFDYALCGITGEAPATWDIDIPLTISVTAPTSTFTTTAGEGAAEAAIRTQAFCAAVNATVNAMLDAYAQARDDEYTTLEVAAAAFALAAAIGAIILTAGAASPLVLGWAIASAALLMAAAYGGVVTSAMVNDMDRRATMQCLMYLSLKEKPITVAGFKSAFAGDACLTGDDESVREMMDAMVNSPYGDDLYMGFVGVLGSATFAGQTGAELPACNFCEERTWCYEWRGAAELQDFANFICGTVGTYISLELCPEINANWNIVFSRLTGIYVPPETTVIAVEFYYHRDNTATTHYLLLNDGHSGAIDLTNPPFGDGWFGYAEAQSYSVTDALLSINGGIYSNGTLDNARIEAIRWRGTGIPLFGICDRCI